MNKLIAIRFNQNISPYKKGDVAGFTQKEAEEIVAKGFAGYVKTELREEDKIEDKSFDAPKAHKMMVAPVKKK